MSQDVLAQLAGEGFQTGPGQMGEQMVIAGLRVESLNEGDRLHIGPAAVLEVMKLRYGCDRFQAIQGRSPDTVDGRLGILARVLTGGPVRVGDEVRVAQAVQA
jgi:MOSC domain-containing protein YiiM